MFRTNQTIQDKVEVIIKEMSELSRPNLLDNLIGLKSLPPVFQEEYRNNFIKYLISCGLSQRHTQTTMVVACGVTTSKHAGKLLNISPKTVKFHLTDVYKVLLATYNKDHISGGHKAKLLYVLAQIAVKLSSKMNTESLYVKALKEEINRIGNLLPKEADKALSVIKLQPGKVSKTL